MLESKLEERQQLGKHQDHRGVGGIGKTDEGDAVVLERLALLLQVLDKLIEMSRAGSAPKFCFNVAFWVTSRLKPPIGMWDSYPAMAKKHVLRITHSMSSVCPLGALLVRNTFRER